MNRKFNFGCGGNHLEGWENYDSEVDISKPLPFPDGCASHVFAEHVVEHISYQDAFGFFQECRRVLQSEGKIRIAIPDLVRIGNGLSGCFSVNQLAMYRAAVINGGHGDGSDVSCLKATMFAHGHRAIWSVNTLLLAMVAAGWNRNKLWFEEFGKSRIGMNDLEGHGKVVGQDVARFETGVVEGIKL